MLFWNPDQNNAHRFSGFQPEARLRATLGQDAPHGRGVSDPSPCAPPRQAGKPGPIGHRVVGFCGTARVEWAWSVWTKNRSGRAVTCVSLPPSQRRAPFRGIHKGVPPYVCFLPCFLHKQKTSRPPGRDRASSAACGTLLKKGKVLHRCTSPTIVWGRKRVQISPEHERLSGGAGFFKGRRPLNALLVPFRASEKGPAARGRTPRIPCRRKAAFFLKR